MKSPFLEYWSERRERGDVLEQRQTLKLSPAQLSSLFGDGDVRAALQKSRVASLLPPVGTEVFRRFTPASLKQINKCMESKNKQAEEDYHLKPAPELESGRVLPFFFGAPPPELQNVPLEDPDPFYQSQKTFVVVAKGNVLTRFNADSSCFHFSPSSLFRRAAIRILDFWLFTALLLVALLLNLFFTLTDSPGSLIAEVVFLCVLSAEAALKVLSRGLCLGRFTFLRDSWNRLDVFIIVSGFLFISVPELYFLKSLRCLKILGLFSGTRRHARTLGRVVIRLWDVLLLTLLVLVVVALVGMGLFSGSLRNKCILKYWDEDNSTSTEFDYFSTDTEFHNHTFDFYAYVNNQSNHYFFEGHLYAKVCGNGSWSSVCPDGYICLRSKKTPNYGLTNYDSFEFALFSTFRLMTRDFWEDLAAQVLQAEGEWMMIYFVAVLFLCSFSLTSFIIAAFIITFAKQTEKEVQEARLDQRDHAQILAALKDKDEDELPEKKDAEQRRCVSCLRRVCSCDCCGCGCWLRLKQGLRAFVSDPFFDLVIILLLILNVCFMSVVHFPLTAELERTLSEAEVVFCCIFALEVVLKVLALGPYAFFQVTWHIFDTVLVVLTLLGLFVDWSFHCFIVFRLFRLARWWPGFLKWMRLAWAGLRSLWTLCLVLVVLFFCFVGVQYFGEHYLGNVCRIASNCELPRWHMANLHHSVMTVTRALAGEWIETMWDCLEVSHHFSCVVFYVTLLVVGNCLIFSLFLTLLMKWVNNKLAPEDEEKMQTLKKRLTEMFKVCATDKKETETEKTGGAEESVALSCVPSEQTDENGTQSGTLPIGEAQNFQKMKESEEAPDVPDNCCCQKCYSRCPALDLDHARGFGRVWCNLRRSMFHIVQHDYFNNFIFLVVLVGSAALVCEDRALPTRPTLQLLLGYMDQVITYLLVLEVLFKWIGLGFRRYFTDAWCCLDLLVTVACVLSMAAQISAPGSGSALVGLKALRPLRILAHVKGTRLSVSVLLRMLPSLLDVLLVTCTVWLFFAVVLVQMYGGKFHYCLNETSNMLFTYDEVANMSDCLEVAEAGYPEVRWKNTHFNFDSVMEAHLSLFSLATLKGWLEIAYSAADSSLIFEQPNYENNSTYFYLFIGFWVFGCFFCGIHILKVLLDSYSAQTLKVGGSHLFLTEKQQKNFDNMTFQSKRPLAPCPRPKGRLRARLYDLVSREAFEWLMQGFVFASVALMMFERYDISEDQEHVMMLLDFALFLVFVVECFLKICAFRRSYFADWLNVLDFAAIVLSLLGFIVRDYVVVYFIRIYCLHLLRLGRISRVVHRLPGALRLRLLFAAWTKSLPALLHLALLLLVLIFTYTSFGAFHFGHLKRVIHTSDVLNFETFGNGLVYMLTVTTWAGWDALLWPAHLTPPECEPAGTAGSEVEAQCVNPALSVAFMVSFLCLSSYVLLLMLLVLLVDMLNVFGAMSCDPLSAVNLSGFFKTWKKFVPDSAHSIQRSLLPDLCDKLAKPLRITKRWDPDLDLSPGDPVHCRDVLLALAVQAVGDSADKETLRARINEKYHEFMPSSPSQESCETSCTLEMNQEEATPVTEETEE